MASSLAGCPTETPPPLDPPRQPCWGFNGDTTTLAFECAEARFVADVGETLEEVPVDVSGDLDGDGQDDLTIGLSVRSTGEIKTSSIHMIWGPSKTGLAVGDALESGLPIHSAADASVTSSDPDALAYLAISTGGDINGDGLDDLVVGSPLYGVDHPGGLFVFYSPLGRSVDLTEADLSMVGENPGDHAGHAVASSADVDLDGEDDILVSAHVAEPGGIVYLLLSSSGPVSSMSDATVKFTTSHEDYNAGWSVDFAGDIDGDGNQDLIIGAPRAVACSGAVYGFYGPFSEDRVIESDADFVRQGRHSGCSGYGFGGSGAGGVVAGAGDVNGDGFDDVLVAATGERDYEFMSGGGNVYLLNGPLYGEGDLDQYDARFTFAADEIDPYLPTGTGLGYSLAVCDIDGDGSRDVVTGMRNGTGVPLFLGPFTGDVFVEEAPVNIDFADGRGAYGTSVSCDGDVDGDGVDDLLVSMVSISDDYGTSGPGEVFLITGATIADHLHAQ